MKYLTVIEETKTGYSTYSPDLPGCVATGETLDEVKQRMREAVEFHLDGLQADGISIPEPHTQSTYIEVPVS